MCRLSWNQRTSISCNSKDLSRSVWALHYSLPSLFIIFPLLFDSLFSFRIGNIALKYCRNCEYLYRAKLCRYYRTIFPEDGNSSSFRKVMFSFPVCGSCTVDKIQKLSGYEIYKSYISRTLWEINKTHVLSYSFNVLLPQISFNLNSNCNTHCLLQNSWILAVDVIALLLRCDNVSWANLMSHFIL